MDTFIHIRQAWNRAYAALAYYVGDVALRAWWAFPAVGFALAAAYAYTDVVAFLILSTMTFASWATVAQYRTSSIEPRLQFARARANAGHAERVRVDALLTDATMRAVRQGGLSRAEVLALRDASQFQSYAEIWRIGR